MLATVAELLHTPTSASSDEGAVSMAADTCNEPQDEHKKEWHKTAPISNTYSTHHTHTFDDAQH